jgi:hypothetical protein
MTAAKSGWKSAIEAVTKQIELALFHGRLGFRLKTEPSQGIRLKE